MAKENNEVAVNNKVELTPAEKMRIAIDKQKLIRQQNADEAKLKLIENADYIGYVAKVEEEEEIVSALNTKLDLLNKMTAIKTNDGVEYKVNAYPVAEYIFGQVMARVLALATVSSSMFTDERQINYAAITEISYLKASKANLALGNPSYFSKGKYNEAIPAASIGTVRNCLLVMLTDLDIDTEYLDAVPNDAFQRWFTVAETKARKQEAEFKKTDVLESSAFKMPTA